MNVNAKSPGYQSGTPYTGTLKRRRLQFGTALGLSLFFGLLLWARLILVTGHPRTATADPAAGDNAHKAPAFDRDAMSYNDSIGTASVNDMEQTGR